MTSPTFMPDAGRAVYAAEDYPRSAESGTYLSGDFDQYWAFHVQQEQQGLYSDGLWTVGEK